MDDISEPGRRIDEVLAESALPDDEELRVFLAELEAEATSVQPIPSHAVSRLMRRHRRTSSRRGRFVVAVVVGATVLAGGAAAASPLSPISESATAIVSGLFGGSPAGGGTAPVPTDAPQSHPQPSRPGPTAPPAAAHGAGSSSDHPTPAPQSSHAAVLPGASHDETGDPNPHPTPRSTHAGGTHG